MAGAAVLLVPWHGSSSYRLNGAGSPTDQCLELREGRAACYGLKKEARLEIPGQKSTISLIAAILAGAVGCSNPSTGNQYIGRRLRNLIRKPVIVKTTDG